jgi:predicted negative regulator of RcsB-dependent stress response
MPDLAYFPGATGYPPLTPTPGSYSCHQLGIHSEAIGSYEQALALFRKDSDPFTEAQIRVHLGDAHQAAGDPVRARAAWRQALTSLESIQHPDAVKVRAKLNSA